MITAAGINPADAAEIRQVVQGYFVQRDPFCPRTRQVRLRRLLSDRLDYHLHPGFGHGLRSLLRHMVEGQLTWQQTKDFFVAQLKGKPQEGAA